MADCGEVAKSLYDVNKSKGNENSKKTRAKRPICDRCKRPAKVCLCEAFPDKPLEISTTVYVLQHPEERRRTLTTVPLLAACLPKDKCIVYNDVRYSQEKYQALHKLLKSPQTLVLYPDANATDLREVVKESSSSQKYNLVVPDGTWRQARLIFKRNDALQQARKVQLNENMRSNYVIRTQPTKNSLSTLEAIAVALSILEERDEITEVLMKPLELLCDIQLQHGAVPRLSKEEKRELLEQEEKKKEMEEQSQNKEIKKHDKIPGKETENPQQSGDDESKQTQEQTGNEIIQQENNQIKKHERDIEHVPKRAKLDD